MSGENLTYERLIGRGWSINEAKGVSSTKFTSLSFCLTEDGHRLICVQGYGRTRKSALDDAVHRANRWELRERIGSDGDPNRSALRPPRDR